MNHKKVSLGSILRWSILGIILLTSMVFHYLHLKDGTKYPSVHAICPYGGIENLWAWLSGRANIQKIFSGTMVLFFLTVIFAAFFKRSFCGNICPFGFLQEIFGFFSRKKFHIPQKIDYFLRYLKYVILVLSVVMAWVTATLWMSPFDPWAAFAHLYNGAEVIQEYLIGIIVLVITLVASIFINRFFCRYLCPAGAIYGIMGKISPLKIERDKKTCNGCKKCDKICSMGIDVHAEERITSAECIQCGRCINSCSDMKNSLQFKVGKKAVSVLVVVSLSSALFFGSLLILDMTGLYRVSLPTQTEVTENKSFIGFQDLRGSMTIEQGAFYTGKELDEFYKIMEIPKSVPKDTLLKQVVTYVPGYDFHAIKAQKGLEK